MTNPTPPDPSPQTPPYERPRTGNQVMMRDLDDPPAAPCCPQAGYCGCGDYVPAGAPHSHLVGTR